MSGWLQKFERYGIILWLSGLVVVGAVGSAFYMQRSEHNFCLTEIIVERGSQKAPGSISFVVSDRWNFRQVIFRDIGFDGTLDECLAISEEGVRHSLKPGIVSAENGQIPEWSVWEKRYLEVRKEVTISLK